jgi:hypothetical protein
MDQSEDSQLVGLSALKELVRAFQHAIGEEGKVLVQICSHFFPHLEQLMQHHCGSSGTPNQLRFMTLIAKIFGAGNSMRLLPFLAEPGRLNNWIGFIAAVLSSGQEAGSPLIALTDDAATIEQLDAGEWWKLKAACAKTALKVF